jgi:hypothetical protein
MAPPGTAKKKYEVKTGFELEWEQLQSTLPY